MLKVRALQEKFSILDKKIQNTVSGIIKMRKTRVSLRAGRKSGFPCFLIFCRHYLLKGTSRAGERLLLMPLAGEAFFPGEKPYWHEISKSGY